MRVIRFVADDGRVLLGEELSDGIASIVRDRRGVLDDPGHRTVLQKLHGRLAVVADDDDNIRDLVATVLEKVGCRCLRCCDGGEAIAALRDEAVDLVVSDIMMPDHNGYEVYSAAKQRDAGMPVLLITGFGYDPSHSLVQASDEGHRSVLYKPFTPQQLLTEVCKAIDTNNGSLRGALQATADRVKVLTLLAPIRPANIICIGRNYPDPARPAAAAGAPVVEELEVFMKPTTALQATGEPVRLPRFDDPDVELDCEGELAVVIGGYARDLEESLALDCVLGYTLANDITARRWQTKGGAPQWMRGKGFDTFCPLGPAVVTADGIDDPEQLIITTTVNGRVVRRGSSSEMIWPVRRLLCELSRRMTLEPGTIILTGSPPRTDAPVAEPAHLKAGDEVAVEVPQIGRLVNRISSG